MRVLTVQVEADRAEGGWTVPLKQTLHDLLVEGGLERIAELAEKRRRALGSLVSLTFDPDPLVSVGRRASPCFG